MTAAWSIGKATQEAPNGLTGVAPNTEGGGDGKITGVTDKMEYRAATDSVYMACPDGEITGLSAGTYFVRYAKDSNHFASPDAAVTVGKGELPADCTITFNLNGGTGSMKSVTVKVGSNYILPACGFTAPADQEFKAWEIGGTEYKVGDSYTVNGNTENKALWENSVITPTAYTVTVSNDGNGTGTATPFTAAAGTTITLTATPNTGYHFKEWKVIKGGVTVKDNKFTMPAADVKIEAVFEKDAPAPSTGGGGGGGTSSYAITVKSAKNGDVTSSHKSASKGTTVTLTVDPDKGYVLDTLTVLDGKDKEIKLTEKNGKYTFTMPASKVTVEAMFKAEQTTGKNPFTDVPAGSFYEDAVIWAVENGITSGTGEGKFSPDATCTRAQIVTFLWRANGSPIVSGNSVFSDVAADAYYAAAVKWAEKNDVTGGIGGGLFGSNNNCTRAQIVTFLYRSVK